MKKNLEKYIIDDRIFSTKFSCDLNSCKGACCTMKGADGAPILKGEVKSIRKDLNAVRKYLSEDNLKEIEENNFYTLKDGKYTLNSVDDSDCVFSFYEDGIARCSFQRAFDNKEINFRKPVSCALFPIRVYGDERNILRYEKISECEPALGKGKNENVNVFEFVKDSLLYEFGKEFYYEMKNKFGEN